MATTDGTAPGMVRDFAAEWARRKARGGDAYRRREAERLRAYRRRVRADRRRAPRGAGPGFREAWEG